MCTANSFHTTVRAYPPPIIPVDVQISGFPKGSKPPFCIEGLKIESELSANDANFNILSRACHV